MNEPGLQDSHLDAEGIAAYLDRRVTPDAARRTREHLYECDECRSSVVDAAQALEHISRRKRRWILPATAAAVAAGLLLIGGPTIQVGEDSPALRGPDSASIVTDPARIGVVSPREGDQVPAVGFRLTWRSAGEDAVYAVSLTDLGGDPVWRTDTRDTSLVVTASVGLESGADYLWYVDALRSDGSSSTSGLQKIRVALGLPEGLSDP